jgi:N-acyl-L-homoserine lactone synthetase
MNVDLTTIQNTSTKQNLLRGMFQQRHRVFKEWMGWDVHSVDREERDEFDRADTTYLAVSDQIVYI